jgi:hypothetical protein
LFRPWQFITDVVGNHLAQRTLPCDSASFAQPHFRIADFGEINSISFQRYGFWPSRINASMK